MWADDVGHKSVIHASACMNSHTPGTKYKRRIRT